MIQRHRLLGQGSIFLKQNPNEAHLTVEQLKKMLTTNSYSSLMSKLMHYAKNITGSTGYWQKSKDWETKMQDVNNYICITPLNEDSFEEDYNTKSEREEWMLMAELTIQTTDTCEKSTPVPHAYWHQVYQYFTNDEINAMPTWINREKNKNSAHHSCETRIIDTSTFSRMQQVA